MFHHEQTTEVPLCIFLARAETGGHCIAGGSRRTWEWSPGVGRAAQCPSQHTHEAQQRVGAAALTPPPRPRVPRAWACIWGHASLGHQESAVQLWGGGWPSSRGAGWLGMNCKSSFIFPSLCNRADEASVSQRGLGGFKGLSLKMVGDLVEVLCKLEISLWFARFPPLPSPAPCCPHSFFVINCFRFRQCLSFGLRQTESLKHFNAHLLRQQNPVSLSFFLSLSLPLQYHSQKVTETQSRSGIGWKGKVLPAEVQKTPASNKNKWETSSITRRKNGVNKRKSINSDGLWETWTDAPACCLLEVLSNYLPCSTIKYRGLLCLSGTD